MQAQPDDADLLTKRLNVDRKSTRLNSSHLGISYAVFCLKKKKKVSNEKIKHHESIVVFNTGAATNYRDTLPVQIQSLHIHRRDWTKLHTTYMRSRNNPTE